MPTSKAKPTTLHEAIAHVQARVPTVAKDKRGQVGNQRYMYATLDAVLEALHDPITEVGLAVYQMPKIGGEGEAYGTCAGCVTVIAKGDEKIEFETLLPVGGGRRDPQTMGSAITYAKRYSLVAFFRLATEDDDGAAASPPRPQQQRPQQQRPQQQRPQRAPQRPPRPQANGRMTRDGVAEIGEAQLLAAFARHSINQETIEARYGKPIAEIVRDPGTLELAISWGEELTREANTQEMEEAAG